jgi:predicted dehydrogenase
MTHSLNRRELLKALGVATAGATLSHPALASLMDRPTEVAPNPLFRPPGRPVTAIVAGAGSRGNTYAPYSLQYPAELKIVGVAEPLPFRRDRFVKKYNIEPQHVFHTWEDIFKVPRFADAVIITTPDRLHYGPAMAALEIGYDLLLEKAIAQSWSQCTDILDLAQAKKRIVAICHELRYAPFFKKIKDVIDSGALGRLISIQWLEPVWNIHMSHSFVRGNWRNTAESNPMLLSKCCHDLDLLSWYVGKPCTRVSSFGSLSWFRKENAPAGSPARCTDGCPVEAACPYSALKIYKPKSGWNHVLDLPEGGDTQAALTEKLSTSPYGRCVYKCDNDVVDHQVVELEFAGGTTASLSMEGHTSYGGRRVRIMGSEGDLVGDESDLFISNFKSAETARWNVNENADLTSGHGGGDYALLAAFIQAVSQQNPNLLSTTIASAMESHWIGFKAEEARAGAKVVDVGSSE